MPHHPCRHLRASAPSNEHLGTQLDRRWTPQAPAMISMRCSIAPPTTTVGRSNATSVRTPQSELREAVHMNGLLLHPLTSWTHAQPSGSPSATCVEKTRGGFS
ncbi:unnamed protein product, partial [Ectocarpus sp. 13 AM-2016]